MSEDDDRQDGARPRFSGQTGREELFVLFAILTVTVVAYAPMVYSVVQLSARTTQAVNALVLLAFAFVEGVAIARRVRPFRPAVNRHGILLFALSCLALAAASMTQLWPMAVLGLCLNVGALLSFGFGREGLRPFYPALAGLGTVIAMLVFVPQFDAALRILAAHFSAAILGVFDLQTTVSLRSDPFAVVLVVEKGVGAFDVVTECNGFGIILSSVVLTIIAAVRRGYPWYLTAALLPLALATGLVFNTLRIAAIVVAAMRTDAEYGLIHEGLGTLVYLLALAAVYALVVAAGRLVRRTPAVR